MDSVGQSFERDVIQGGPRSLYDESARPLASNSDRDLPTPSALIAPRQGMSAELLFVLSLGHDFITGHAAKPSRPEW